MTLLWRHLRSLAAGALALVLCGCASLQHDALRSQTSGIPTQVEIESVPFYAQEKYQCGPAALAMVFAHAGVQQTPDQLASEVHPRT